MADSKKYNGNTWEHSLRKLTTATADIEPTIYTDGTAITSYTIKGNTVDANGVGARTENLVPPPLTPKSETVNGLTFNVRSDGVVEINGTATESTNYSYKLKTPFTMPTSKTRGGNGYLYWWNTFTSTGTIRLRYNNQQVDFWSISPINRVINKFDSAENATIDEIEIRIPSGGTINGSISIMVTDNGETASAFIPYGYKTPLSNGQQTIDIYIGDLPLLKSLDGTAVDEISNGTLTRRVDTDGSVLPTPITTQITMPSIPTTQGANNITVNTAVQPSEFSATWTGWHEASVKEWGGSQWS